ncbi:Ankyrin repeat domain-containing protein 18A, partial [Durusdinium trenchii]
MADGDVSVDQRKAFLTAAELGLQDVVRKELQGRNRRLLISFEDNLGRGAVHLAAKGGQQEVIGLLHDHGVLLEALDRNGRTPLHLACEHGRLEAAAILLERGCQADVQDACGRTCLHLAVCSQEPRLCHLLLSSCQSLVRRCDGKGRSPLSYAVMNSTSSVAEECVQLLLRSLAEPDLCDEFGLSPLHYAAKQASQGVVQLLHEKVADLFLEASGRTALDPKRDITRDLPDQKSRQVAHAQYRGGDWHDQAMFVQDGLEAMQSRFYHIMKDVQAAGIHHGQHKSRPFLFDGSWMKDVHSHQQLLGGELASVPGPEACIRVFNLLYPPSDIPKASLDDLDIVAYYNASWDRQDPGLAPLHQKDLKDSKHTEVFAEQREALKLAEMELEEGRLREMRLNAELQASLQDMCGAEKEARGEGAHSLGWRVLRAGRQLAQRTEELRSAQVFCERLHCEASNFEKELKEARQHSTECQVAEMEAQKRLEKELHRQGEEKSWKLIAEEDRHRVEVLGELLEHRLEEAEVAAARARRSESIAKDACQKRFSEEALELDRLRRDLVSEETEAAKWESLCNEVWRQAGQELEERAESHRAEALSARYCQEREQKLTQQLRKGEDHRLELEEEVAKLKAEARTRDAQWQEMFRLYPTVGHAFFGNARGDIQPK